jgi:predicted TIM-barrel fold metal-dependent hydrolase
VEHNRRVVNDAIDIFGPERCMFASNFPVDRLGGDYHTIMSGFMEIVADRPLAQQRMLFHDNAVRYYRL